jgi:hypothetical protein
LIDVFCFIIILYKYIAKKGILFNIVLNLIFN